MCWRWRASYGCQVFFPSSIGAFGPTTPRDATPQVTVQRPTTIYGVTKVAGELLCDYYAQPLRHRHARSAAAGPHLLRRGAGRRDDGLRGRDVLSRRALRAVHVLPLRRYPPRHDVHAGCDHGDDGPDGSRERAPALSQRLQRRRHERHAGRARRSDRAGRFRVSLSTTRSIPVRQAIADSWPRSLDDSAAHHDWGFAPRYDLEAMTTDMLARLKTKLAAARNR